MRLAALLFALFTFPTLAVSQQSLQQQIHAIAASAHGKVSVACSLPGTPLDCDLDPTAHPPMQSVFKLPLVLTVLHQVEGGKFSLDQLIPFKESDLILPKPFSPLQDKYPHAGVDLPLRELLRLTVGLSDNTAADILLRLAGGPQVVVDYLASLGITGFHLQDNERALHRDHHLQYRNWFEPQAAVRLLRTLSDRSPITPANTDLLLQWMTVHSGRLDGDLPTNTIVAHKAGTSFVDNGIAAATNDIALITLPDGSRLAIAVFITDSAADESARFQAIARIGRAIYDAALTNHNR
ncbi:MAG: class A beta-lactamase [Acidobacteria bacterium]|nr:class A beta-lactamase [Acidobacteriota bacterium]